MGRGKKAGAGAFLPFFPLPIVPRALSFLPLPSLLTTQRGFSCWGERAILPKSGKARENGIFEII